MDIAPGTFYGVGLSVALLFALIWSFVLDRQKPPTIKEFLAKLAARALLLGFLVAVLIGFFLLVPGFWGKPPA